MTDRASDRCPTYGPLGPTHDRSPYGNRCLKCGRPLEPDQPLDEEAGAAARLDDDADDALRARPGSYRRLGRISTRVEPLAEQLPLEPDPEDDP